MRSDSPRVLRRLLDPAFGFFVWALHFLLIYITEAVACALGLGKRAPSVRTGFVMSLAIVTLIATAIVAVHAVRRRQQNALATDDGFLIWIAIGQDAIAAVAILWQLLPIFMVPICQ